MTLDKVYQEQILAEIKGFLHSEAMRKYEEDCDMREIKTSPHMLYPVKVTQDGNMYCCLYGENLQEGIAGFGKSPKEACDDFDRIWMAGQPSAH